MPLPKPSPQTDFLKKFLKLTDKEGTTFYIRRDQVVVIRADKDHKGTPTGLTKVETQDLLFFAKESVAGIAAMLGGV